MGTPQSGNTSAGGQQQQQQRNPMQGLSRQQILAYARSMAARGGSGGSGAGATQQRQQQPMGYFAANRA